MTARRLRAFLALVVVVSLGCRAKAKPTSHTELSFIEDDYDGALRRARAEKRPLFVDAWAPWCHTCLSMKAYVFNDPLLVPIASQFVWAAVDTEKKTSEGFLRKFAMQNWPTLWVIDSATEKPILKWAGSATASELAMLLESVTLQRSSDSSKAAEAAASWLRGNREAAEDRRDAAIVEYQNALARAPSNWSGRGRVVEALALQLQASERSAECSELAVREWPKVPPGTSRLNVVLSGLGCGDALPKDAPLRNELPALVREATRIVTSPAEPVLADDRSSLFEQLVLSHRSNGNEPEALAIGRAWGRFLENEAARAANPIARAVFDSHRLLAYEAIREPQKAIPMLEQSARDFPDDYNAPIRLAKVYLDLGRLDEALAASRRAEAKVYGPRTLRVLSMQADILLAMERPDEAKQVLLRAVSLGEKLELPGGYRQLLDQLRRRTAGL
ncbi:MAG TPA: thioredoxin family protein [Polyangiaceae bacterium]